MILNIQWVTEEIKEEIKNKCRQKHNDPTSWDAAKSALKGKFMMIEAELRKEEKIQIKNLKLHLEELEKEEQRKPKISGRK